MNAVARDKLIRIFQGTPVHKAARDICPCGEKEKTERVRADVPQDLSPRRKEDATGEKRGGWG